MDDDLRQPQFWTVEDQPHEDDVHALRQKLRAYNQAYAQGTDGCPLAIFLRTTDQELVAGISGYLWGRCLEIDFLWVHETLRGKGVGAQLVRALEAAAIQRGGQYVTLDTFSFQAPDFYRKLGYELFGVVDGYGNGYQKLFFRKRLP